MMRAEYKDTGTNNPLIDALPEMRNGADLMSLISSEPKVHLEEAFRWKNHTVPLLPHYRNKTA